MTCPMAIKLVYDGAKTGQVPWHDGCVTPHCAEDLPQTIPQLSQTMQTLLTTTTEDLAATLGYGQRPDRSKFTPSPLVQPLVYGWLGQLSASIEHLAQMAGRLGVEVSPQAIVNGLPMPRQRSSIRCSWRVCSTSLPPTRLPFRSSSALPAFGFTRARALSFLTR